MRRDGECAVDHGSRRAVHPSTSRGHGEITHDGAEEAHRCAVAALRRRTWTVQPGQVRVIFKDRAG
ncbi:MAG: hypothetical protein M9927_22260 [Anaerolineae bacterium]|nr:hypothetical protein [Anaerolineae bacterium]